MSLVSQHLTLKKSGRNFVGLCPFHSEKSPSFVVNPEKQFFHCFGCSAGGDVFHFLSKIEQITFPEAVRRLANTAGVPLPDLTEKEHSDSEADTLYRINEQAAHLFHQDLLHRPEAEPARRYLENRGISEATIRTFDIGFSLPRREDWIKRLKVSPALLEKVGLLRHGEKGVYDPFRNRILLPIKTVSGRIVGFGGRVFDDRQPKYLNTHETPIFTKGKHLYGLHLARGKRSLIIVEGYFDAISLHQQGITNAVATLGTAVTPDHLRQLHRSIEKVSLIFDPDTAGQAALLRIAPLFLEEGLLADVISLPPGEDPDLFIRRNGQAAFLKQAQQAKPLLEFVIAQKTGSPSVEPKTKTLDELFRLIQKIPHTVEQGYYLKKIAESWDLNEKDVRADFAQAIRAGHHPVLRGTGKKPDQPPLASSPSGRISKEEEMVLALWIQDRMDPKAMGNIHPKDFTTPDFTPLIAALWDDSGSWHRSQEVVDTLTDLERGLLTKLATLNIPDENLEKIQSDCIRLMQTKRLQREAAQIQKELKAAEREQNRTQTERLQHRFFDLKKELSQKMAS